MDATLCASFNYFSFFHIKQAILIVLRMENNIIRIIIFVEEIKVP
jgi:hypothetical protein